VNTYRQLFPVRSVGAANFLPQAQFFLSSFRALFYVEANLKNIFPMAGTIFSFYLSDLPRGSPFSISPLV